jgi:hypothetical protein
LHQCGVHFAPSVDDPFGGVGGLDKAKFREGGVKDLGIASKVADSSQLKRCELKLPGAALLAIGPE